MVRIRLPPAGSHANFELWRAQAAARTGLAGRDGPVEFERR
jgi:hypothetical protein